MVSNSHFSAVDDVIFSEKISARVWALVENMLGGREVVVNLDLIRMPVEPVAISGRTGKAIRTS